MDRTVFNYPKYHPSQAMLSGLMLAKRFFFILAAIMCPAVWAEARCDQQAAILESVEGKVEWTSAESQWQTAVRGDVFCYGDQIRVLEQRAALRLANNTLVRLQENSVVTLLQEDKGFWIGLLRGAGHFLSRTPKQLTVDGGIEIGRFNGKLLRGAGEKMAGAAQQSDPEPFVFL